MPKPARLYPKPEPIAADPKVMIFGSAIVGIIFFALGWSFQSIMVIA